LSFVKLTSTQSLPQSLEKLRGLISDAIIRVDAAVSQGTWEDFQNRLDICRVTHGEHIQCLYVTFHSFSLHVPSYFIVVTVPVN